MSDSVGVPHVSQKEARQENQRKNVAGGNKQQDYIAKEDASLILMRKGTSL
jgi:hypothetical protein